MIYMILYNQWQVFYLTRKFLMIPNNNPKSLVFEIDENLYLYIT